MSTVADVVKDALLHLKVQDPVEDVPAELSAQGIRKMNLMMRRWEASGIAVGWVDVTSPTQAMPCPPEAEETIGYNLALRWAPDLGKSPDPVIVGFAKDGLADLVADIANVDATRICYDLPRAEASGYGDFYTDSYP